MDGGGRAGNLTRPACGRHADGQAYRQHVVTVSGLVQSVVGANLARPSADGATLFTPSLRSPNLCVSSLYALRSDNALTRHSPSDGDTSMHILDGLSLLLASGLFIYLLVALLRAGRN